MKIGNVVGAVWATRKAQCLQGQTFLVVESDGQRIVAADQVGAGVGDRVLTRRWWPSWMVRMRNCSFAGKGQRQCVLGAVIVVSDLRRSVTLLLW